MKKIFLIIGILCLFFTISIFAGSCITSPPFSGGRVLTNGEIIYLDTDANKIRIYKYDINSQNFSEIKSFNRDVETKDILESADLDNVGTDEIILADASDDKIHIYDISSGNLNDLRNYNKGISRHDDIAVGDVNGDGLKEIILGDASVDSSSGHSIKILNYISGDEIGYIKVSGGYERYDRVAAGDIDGDGIDEIVFGDASSDNIIIYKWNDSATGHFEKVRQFNVDYSREDEIAVADVNGDGKAEIIFGEGATDSKIEDNRQRIIIFDEYGTILGKSPNIDFRSEDTLTAGDVTMNGRAEIIVGKDNDDMIKVYEVGNDFGIELIAAFNVGYKYGEKLAVGDIDGDSLIVGRPECRGQSTIDNDIIAVINAPPKHMGVNYEPGIFTAGYEQGNRETIGNTVTSIQGFSLTVGLSYKFNLLGFFDIDTSLESKYSQSYKTQTGKKFTTTITKSLTADMEDKIVTITTTYDVYEYPVLNKFGNQLILNGKPQYLLVTVPIDIGTLTIQPFVSMYHILGDITSYPKQVSELYRYPNKNIFDINLWITQDPIEVSVGTDEYSINSSEISSEVKVSADAKISAGGGTVHLAGDYTNKFIGTHTIEFEKNTSIEIKYKGGITESDKQYCAHAVVYYDKKYGYLVLDWLVPNFGNYYKQSSGNNGLGNIGNMGNILNMGNIFNNPLLFNIPQLMGMILPLPNGEHIYNYDNNGQTNRDQNPENCMPIGYNLNSDNISFFIDLPSFEQPVDLYFGLYMPDLDPDNIYILTSNNEVIPVSQGLVPWIGFTTGNLIQDIFGQIPVSIIPSGTYYFYLLACPANATDPLQNYYVWSTTYIKQ